MAVDAGDLQYLAQRLIQTADRSVASRGMASKWGNGQFGVVVEYRARGGAREYTVRDNDRNFHFCVEVAPESLRIVRCRDPLDLIEPMLTLVRCL